jgi:uncharacterized protein
MMARHWGAAAIFLVSLLVNSGIGLADPRLPARTGAVVDAANIIGANQEQSLAAKAAKLQSQSGIELVVVTLPSLQGYSIERWGRDLGNRWQVGGNAARGVVLIVAPNDRQVRIEAGDGLPLPDNVAASIVNNIIVPQFRSGEMSGGILVGVDAITRAVDGPPPDDASGWQWPSFSNVNWSGVGVCLILGVLILLVVLKTIKDGWQLPSDYDRSSRDIRSSGSASDNDGYFFGSSNSSWSDSSSGSSWSSSSDSSSSSSGSSGGFSGSGASGRW